MFYFSIFPCLYEIITKFNSFLHSNCSPKSQNHLIIQNALLHLSDKTKYGKGYDNPLIL